MKPEQILDKKFYKPESTDWYIPVLRCMHEYADHCVSQILEQSNQSKMEQPIKFESWAIVEIMGHTKVAGMCQTQNFGNTVMLRVDIPETENHPAHTKMYGMSSIFSISPVDQETATAHANVFNVSPIIAYEVQMAIQKRVIVRAEEEITRRLNQAPVQEERVWHPNEDDDFEEEEYDYHGNLIE